MNATAKELPPGQSEAELRRSDARALDQGPPAARCRSPVHLECRVRQIMSIGDGPIAANLVIGEVVLIHIDDAVLDATGHVDPRKLRTIARLGGSDYCRERSVSDGTAVSGGWSSQGAFRAPDLTI